MSGEKALKKSLEYYKNQISQVEHSLPKNEQELFDDHIRIYREAQDIFDEIVGPKSAYEIYLHVLKLVIFQTTEKNLKILLLLGKKGLKLTSSEIVFYLNTLIVVFYIT